MKTGKLKVKQPSQLQEILNVARSLIDETVLLSVETLPTLETKTKLQQLKNVLEMYGHFSGINRKVQFKYQAKGKSKSSSSEDGKLDSSMQIKTWPTSLLGIVNLLQIKMKMTVRRRCCWFLSGVASWRLMAEHKQKTWGKLFANYIRARTAIQQTRTSQQPDFWGFIVHTDTTWKFMRRMKAEFKWLVLIDCLGLPFLAKPNKLIFISYNNGSAASFTKGLLALEGELAPILVQMVKSANTNGLLDNDSMSATYQNE